MLKLLGTYMYRIVPRGFHRSGQRTEAGFTLIEILVVIALIVVFATLVLLPFREIRVKSRNAAIREDIDQIRVLAEDVFDDNGGVGYCGTGLACASTDPRMTKLKEDIDRQNGSAGGQPTMLAGDSFCVEAVLADSTGYCADSNGAFTTSGSATTGRCSPAGLCE